MGNLRRICRKIEWKDKHFELEKKISFKKIQLARAQSQIHNDFTSQSIVFDISNKSEDDNPLHKEIKPLNNANYL